jgi:uncharacterized membrane protein
MNIENPKVKLIGSIVIVSLFILVSIGVAYADKLTSCPYDNVTGNYISPSGKEYAFGTMETASNCAFLGLLPKVVQDRLGSIGDVQTRKDTELILKLNKNANK